jgi:hypothetical protein
VLALKQDWEPSMEIVTEHLVLSGSVRVAIPHSLARLCHKNMRPHSERSPVIAW